MTDLLNRSERNRYRQDIDGLRAVAVIAVILFHLGGFPNGYLGVDVFFVISGFLITGIIRREQSENRFSLINFYIRRIRRIIPLTLFVCGTALLVGALTMLPDDLENLGQSVVATNVFSNNILQAITTKNYWDIVNEYKPLMHTWSLGVEEQYYMFYPLLFLLIPAKKKGWLITAIGSLATFSLAITFLPYQPHQKFYYIFFRYWELAAGGLAALTLPALILVRSSYAKTVSLIVLIALMFSPVSIMSSGFALVVTVGLTLGILVTQDKSGKPTILEMRWLVAIGRISFSLYMWHQVVLAYMRYLWTQDLKFLHWVFFFFATGLLSIFSFYAIEQPFRNRKRIGTSKVLTVVVAGMILTTVSALYIHQNAGVLRDIPELGIDQSNKQRGMHNVYNHRIDSYDDEFEDDDRLNVLVIGNSFARDWANVVLESRHAPKVEISYSPALDDYQMISSRIAKAHVIFYSTPEEESLKDVKLPLEKVWAIGTKNFGHNNGVFYNYVGSDRYEQRTKMDEGQIELETKLKGVWGERHLSFIDKVIDDDETMPVFTPSQQFISQDCRHLTKMGAKFFADLFNGDLEKIFDSHTP